MDAGPEDLCRPGHVPTVRVDEPPEPAHFGRNDSAVWLCRQAGLHAAATLSTLVDPTGGLTNVAEGRQFASRHLLPAATLRDVVLQVQNGLEAAQVRPERRG
jgi:3,4-dihydroxy-2-butanone 4-phosphate synthase